jgi:hypothetical protein
LKQELTLALQRDGGLLVPLMRLSIEVQHFQGFLDSLVEFSRYVPLVVLLENSIITGYELTPLGVAIKGSKLEKMT